MAQTTTLYAVKIGAGGFYTLANSIQDAVNNVAGVFMVPTIDIPSRATIYTGDYPQDATANVTLPDMRVAIVTNTHNTMF